MSRIVDRRSLAATAIAVLLAGALSLVTSAAPAGVAAADPPQLTARVLLDGHARLGSWIAIEVRVRNDGPPILGELRLTGGAQGGTRYSVVADLPTTSDKTFILHAQPPSFGQQLVVSLVAADQVVARQEVGFTLHDQSQLTIGVVAAEPQRIVGRLDIDGGRDGTRAAVIPLDVGDLPERIEAWSALDRLIWQDVDTSTLSSRQLDAMRGWLALGGRLVVVAGSTGPGVLSGLPDDILPYRPTTTIDVAPESLAGLIGAAPDGATDLPALAGDLGRGRSLATSGDRVVAAEAAYGSGSVAVIGFDPTVGWLADLAAGEAFWRSMVPPRSSGAIGLSDDGSILQAVSQLPALALPPIGGLLILLFGYILLIGPVNYLVLRRLDRREWAWVTMPVLIAVFVAGSYGFGAALRGSDVIVNEVAVVRGAPDTTDGSAAVYLGVFSPTRGTYQLASPAGALLSAPISGDIFGGDGLTLDILQGQPSRVRNLSIGFGSLRTVRAETPAVVPRIHAELEVVDGVLVGSVRNDSEVVLEQAAVVFGSNVAVLDDIAPGATTTVSVPLRDGRYGPSLSDRIFGQDFFAGSASEQQRRSLTRRQILEYVTYDRVNGSSTTLDAEVPVVLAWGRAPVLEVEVEGHRPTRAANALYVVPTDLAIRGRMAFRADLLRSTVVESDAAFFTKEAGSIGFGQGSVTLAYRPVAFRGTFDVTAVRLGLGFGGGIVGDGGGVRVEPLPRGCALDDREPGEAPPAACPLPAPPERQDGVPEVEVFDRVSGAWLRIPHLNQGVAASLDAPERYVDPGSGTFLVRLVNEGQDQVYVSFDLVLEGTIG